MKQIIDWLNSNQGFFLGVLTLIYTLSTVTLVLLAYVSNKLVIKTIQSYTCPNISAKCVFTGNIYVFSIENIGMSPAYNIKIDIRDNYNIDNTTAEEVFKHKYYLPQKSKKEFIIGNQTHRKSIETNVVHIIYYDSFGNNYNNNDVPLNCKGEVVYAISHN